MLVTIIINDRLKDILVALQVLISLRWHALVHFSGHVIFLWNKYRRNGTGSEIDWLNLITIIHLLIVVVHISRNNQFPTLILKLSKIAVD